MKQTKIIFFGTTEFASGILQTLIDEGYNVVAVVSQPDKPVGRKHTIQMTKAMDAGDIYARVTTPLGKDETMAELNQRLLVLSKQLVKDNLEDYIAGKLVGEPQDDNKVILGLNITKEEEKVQFAVEDVQTLYNHIRGLIDWPMPYGVVDGKRMKFCKVRMRKEDHQVKPGEILGFKNHAMEVASIGGIIEVYELQPEGKSRMTADAYANGTGRNMIGKVFE